MTDRTQQTDPTARREYPNSDAVSVFHALTHNDAGDHDAAVAELLTVVTGHAEVTT
jgi:hypothetical protein